MSDFTLGKLALVCRWRLANRHLPLENRHLRALGARTVNGEHVSTELVAWAKQHIEWTLDEGARKHPDGVLMLALDEGGRAAMTVGSYKPLEHTTANDLIGRARGSRSEAQKTGVSPEDIWAVQGNALVWVTSADFKPSGASTLVADLARTLGMPVRRDSDLLTQFVVQGVDADEVFLVSDEHGVVPASDRSGERAQKFSQSYQKLLQSMRAK